MEIASLVAVEIGLDIELIVAKTPVAAYDAEKQCCSGRTGPETLSVKFVTLDRDEIRRETRSARRATPVKISPHPDKTSDTHRQLRIAAHKEEIRRFWVLETPELVIIEILYQIAYRIGLGILTSSEKNNLVVVDERIVPLLHRTCGESRNRSHHREQQT